jgi:hypothetical protein
MSLYILGAYNGTLLCFLILERFSPCDASSTTLRVKRRIIKAILLILALAHLMGFVASLGADGVIESFFSSLANFMSLFFSLATSIGIVLCTVLIVFGKRCSER